MASNKYSGAQKAAIILMAFGEEIAGNIFKNMSEFEIKRIGGAMSRLGRVDEDVVNDAIEEFHGILNKGTKFLYGGTDFTKNVIGSAFKGQDGEELIDSLQLEHGATLESLELIDPRNLAAFLRNEHPQTIALIIAHLDPKKMGETLKLLPEALHSEILLRVASLDAVSPDIIDDVEDVLRNEIQALGTVTSQQLGGVEPIAEMLNLMDKASEESILDGLEERDPELAESIRQLMFVFDDLIKIDDRGIQELIKNVNNEKWKIALKTCSEGVRELVYKNMSQRAATMLREDMEAMGATKLSEVETAQYEIVTIARKLEEEGKIVLQTGGDSQYV